MHTCAIIHCQKLPAHFIFSKRGDKKFDGTIRETALGRPRCRLEPLRLVDSQEASLASSRFENVQKWNSRIIALLIAIGRRNRRNRFLSFSFSSSFFFTFWWPVLFRKIRMTEQHDEAIESCPEPGQDGRWSKFFAVGKDPKIGTNHMRVVGRVKIIELR